MTLGLTPGGAYRAQLNYQREQINEKLSTVASGFSGTFHMVRIGKDIAEHFTKYGWDVESHESPDGLHISVQFPKDKYEQKGTPQ